eukprot:TRINITY_DN6145_c0_g1_i3.p1 TRINITY_DN6145_c0_g1~~TRINITY_DN6145_c0_g1_i3.p1  ORF type:complete len:250 (-),score=42.00 TRINITY_DN6145_c0_g1_i3:68-817(-)
MSILDDEVFSKGGFFPQPSHDDLKFDIVECDEGVKLYCYYDDRNTPSFLGSFFKPKPKTIVYFHGNGELVEDYVRNPEFIDGFVNAGFSVFLVEYRGYGKSTGRPTFVSMFADLVHIHKHLVKNLRIPEKDIIAYGRSIGSLYATEFALRFPNIGALVIECGFANPTNFLLERLEKSVFEKFPRESVVDEITKHLTNFQKLQKLPSSLPVLVLHAKDDKIIPYSEAQLNFDSSISSHKKWGRRRRGGLL